MADTEEAMDFTGTSHSGVPNFEHSDGGEESRKKAWSLPDEMNTAKLR
jgi:hypothetical protein